MTYNAYTEDTLVQQTTAEHIEKEHCWKSVYPYNQETFGSDGILGRILGIKETLRRLIDGEITV